MKGGSENLMDDLWSSYLVIVILDSVFGVKDDNGVGKSNLTPKCRPEQDSFEILLKKFKPVKMFFLRNSPPGDKTSKSV